MIDSIPHRSANVVELRARNPQRILVAFAASNKHEGERLARQLRSRAHQVRLTQDSDELLDLMSEQRYPAAVIDNDFDDDGIKISSTLRFLWAHAGVAQQCRLILVARAKIHEQQWRAAGVSGCFVRPIEVGALVRLIERRVLPQE